MTEHTLNLEDVRQLTEQALMGAGASEESSRSVARSTVLAERDGIRSHGLMYVPIYAEHLQCGKVDGKAEAVVSSCRKGVISVDAKNGFAHPAIDAGWGAFIDATKEVGVAVLTVHNSYNCGVLGHHSQRIAEEGLVGLCFTHAPASIAPVGAKTPVIGTNPFAFSVPDGEGGVALSIDQSASAVAKSEILLRSRTGKAIEEGWALDENGNSTTDPVEALKGSMVPSGGYKGFGIGLMVEVLASCLAGAVLSKDASPFSGTKGGPPSTGQFFVAFDPEAFLNQEFAQQVEALVGSITSQDGAHLPGSKAKLNRLETESFGVAVADNLLERIKAFTNL